MPAQVGQSSLKALPSETDGSSEWKRGVKSVLSQELAEKMDDLLEHFLSE
jgi:hypothetical protein